MRLSRKSGRKHRSADLQYGFAFAMAGSSLPGRRCRRQHDSNSRRLYIGSMPPSHSTTLSFFRKPTLTTVTFAVVSDDASERLGTQARQCGSQRAKVPAGLASTTPNHIADIGVAPIGSDRSVTDHLRLLRHRVRSHRCRHDGIVENDACTTGQRSKAGRVIRLVDVFVDGLRLPTGSNGRRAAEP